MQEPGKAVYGISQSGRLVLVIALLAFVAGGTLSVVGVASQKTVQIVVGVCIMTVGVGTYTIAIMFTSVTGPPSGFDLKDFETVEKIKPASFSPNRQSKLALTFAFFLFLGGCVMVVLGFNFDVAYMWIPGYSMAVIAFIAYTAVVLYGPMTISPGAIIVSFPDDAVPAQPQTILTAQYTRRMASEDPALRTRAYAKTVADASEYDTEARGFQGFEKYKHCAKGYTPAEYDGY